MEDSTIQNPAACEEMENCHFFNSKIMPMQKMDVHAAAENGEDVAADISKYISFCIVTLKTSSLIAEGIFEHYVNNRIFQEILERIIAVVEKDSASIYIENTVITWK